MATKTKTAAVGHSSSGKSLDALFAQALELMSKSNYDGAVAALENVRTEALAQGMVALARSAGNYITAIHAKTEGGKDTAMNPVLAVQLCLNRGDADEALALVDRAIKTDAQDARLFYLKATAFAQKGEAEASAEALGRAVALNPDFFHQFRLERDFDRVRSTSAFSSIGQD